MDFQLSEDEQATVSAVQSILADHGQIPQSQRLCHAYFDFDLQQTLRETGFLDTRRDLGPVAAALVVYEAARVPAVVEVGASALVVPALFPEEQIDGPVALILDDRRGRSHRNLSVARYALAQVGRDAVLLPVSQDDVEPVESIYAYPFGRFSRTPEWGFGKRIPNGAGRLRQWARVALANEFAGAARSALEFTVDYVLHRRVFGQAVGTFQAVRHRLAQCHQLAMGIQYLAMRAAWSGEVHDANLAACHAQRHVGKLMTDLHQFNGAMAVTNEHLLHFWTYRLRALQAEVGGAREASLEVADTLWGPATYLSQDRQAQKAVQATGAMA